MGVGQERHRPTTQRSIHHARQKIQPRCRHGPGPHSGVSVLFTSAGCQGSHLRGPGKDRGDSVHPASGPCRHVGPATAQCRSRYGVCGTGVPADIDRLGTGDPPGYVAGPGTRLATDTGKVSDGGRTWGFTLRDDVTWQDGKPVTCADVKYGVSRSYATTQITGGLTYALDFLDVAYNTDGSSTYVGPYDKTGQEAFDKAVTCSGQTITFKLARAVPDFNQVVALSAFAPVRSDKDRGAQSVTEIFSDGPYMLRGAWQVGKGGTFVRNPQWHQRTDPIRRARPG